MSEFRARRIGGPSLGELIVEYRLLRGMTLSALSQATRIQEKYLAAFEAEDERVLPEPVYQRMFLKTMAAALDAPEEEFLARHNQEIEQSLAIPETRRFPRIAERWAFFVAPRILAMLGILGVSALLVGALGFEIRRIVAPPSLELQTPSDGLESAAPSVVVHGETERGVEVRVNGVVVYLKSNGDFTEEVHLHHGVNVIKISAKKKRSSERVLYRTVLWSSPSGEAAVSRK